MKEGTTLFTIEPETYKLKLEQAQAAEAGAQASLKQAETRLQASVRPGRAAGRLAGDPRYVHFDARQRPGQSAAGPGQHQDRRGQLRLYQCRRAVRRHRQRASGLGRRTGRRGVADPACDHRAARSDLREFQRQRTGRAADPRRSPAARLDAQRSQALPIEVGLQTESGYPHKGKLDYVAPTLNQSTGTLAVRGVLPNPDRVLLPGYYVRVRVPFDQEQNALLVPDCRARQRSGRTLCAGRERRQCRRAAQGADRAARGRLARDRKRPEGR